jgi:hypothetical protein
MQGISVDGGVGLYEPGDVFLANANVGLSVRTTKQFAFFETGFDIPKLTRDALKHWLFGFHYSSETKKELGSVELALVGFYVTFMWGDYPDFKIAVVDDEEETPTGIGA